MPLPAAFRVDAGLAFQRGVRGPILTLSLSRDLNAMRTASHAAVTLAGAANTNPLTLTGQQIGLSIANLTAAP
jgi:hypothetical protein